MSDGLLKVIGLLGANTENGRKALDILKRINDLVPPNSVTQQDKIQVLQTLGMEAAKQGQQMRTMMASQQQAAHAGAAPGGQPQPQPQQAQAA